MNLRSPAAALVFCLACAAQNTLTVEQLIAFVKSSIERKMTDVEISRYLRTVKLDHRLSDSQFEDLITAGLGQRTLQALHALQDQSAGLPVADAPPPKAPSPHDAARAGKRTHLLIGRRRLSIEQRLVGAPACLRSSLRPRSCNGCFQPAALLPAFPCPPLLQLGGCIFR